MSLKVTQRKDSAFKMHVGPLSKPLSVEVFIRHEILTNVLKSEEQGSSYEGEFQRELLKYSGTLTRNQNSIKNRKCVTKFYTVDMNRWRD